MGVPSITLGFRLRPLGLALLRGLSVEDSSSLDVLREDGVEGLLDESTTGLGPDNLSVIFKGDDAIMLNNG